MGNCDCKRGCNTLSFITSVEKVLEAVPPHPGCEVDPGPECQSDAVLRESLLNHELLKAARDGQVEQIRLFLRKGAYVETRRPFAIAFDGGSVGDEVPRGLTPLMYAAQGGYAKAVEVLVAAGAHVNAEEEDGMRPLHFAAAAGNPETCRALLTARADPSATDNDGLTALERVPAPELSTKASKAVWKELLAEVDSFSF
mmetsp:Transcript_21554/g.49331  ORF Transcript_21554/g.49331 Transcript_21554/m.49331 type:complete len:199 (+) Transcript_21554:114-710(+)